MMSGTMFGVKEAGIKKCENGVDPFYVIKIHDKDGNDISIFFDRLFGKSEKEELPSMEEVLCDLQVEISKLIWKKKGLGIDVVL